jgi:aminopeptidase N
MLTFLRLACLIAFAVILGGCSSDATGQDSGGELLPEQAAYDVTFYDLHVEVDTAAQSIDGTLTVVAAVERPMADFVLNLDGRLAVSEATLATGGGETELPVQRKAGDNQLWMALPETARPGDTLRVTVEYGGSPRVAPRPPWDGGFTWDRTPNGEPWIATSCQTFGADMW